MIFRSLAVLALPAAAPVASEDETESLRKEIASHVLMKTLVHLGVGTIGWYLFSYALAYDDPYSDDGILENGFIGTDPFAAKGFLETDEDRNLKWVDGTNHVLAWFFQWASCTAAATIVSGAVAESVLSYSYAAHAVVMSSFIYPVVVALTCGYGWLAGAPDVGCIDFAGKGIAHLRGRVSGLAGTTVFGPRKRRSERSEDFEPHNLPLVALGTLALWFGWYGFNCGSTLGTSSVERGAMAAQGAIAIAAAIGGVVVFFLRFPTPKQADEDGGLMGVYGTTHMLAWFFQWAFGTADSTVVSGAVAEHVLSYTYAAHAFVMSSFIYSVVVALSWGYGCLAAAPCCGLH